MSALKVVFFGTAPWKKRHLMTIGLVAFALQAAQQAYGEAESWAALHAQAVGLRQQGQTEEALGLAEEALSLSVRSFGPEHHHVAVSSYHLGSLYQAQGKSDLAELFFERAQRIDAGAYGLEKPSAVEPSEEASPADVSPSESEEWSVDPEYWRSAGLQPPGETDTPPQEAEDVEGEEGRWWKIDTALKGGYRQDDLNWNIAGNIGGQNPNVLSELTWTDVESRYLAGDVWFIARRLLAVRGRADYGWIYNGDNQDSDFLGNNRTLEFSRSNNASDEGHVADASLGLGYPWGYATPGLRLSLTPLAGYSFHEQRLTITNGNQTIPATGPFENLHSEYLARWVGPWAGLDVALRLKKKWGFFAAAEYHWADYEANATWNLRTDLSQPESFRHLADGHGWVTSLGVGYAPWRDWSFRLSLDMQSWSTDPGIDRTFPVTGSVSETRLNVVDWDTYAVSLGVEARF